MYALYASKYTAPEADPVIPGSAIRGVLTLFKEATSRTDILTVEKSIAGSPVRKGHTGDR